MLSKLKLWQKIFIGLFLGIVVGVIFGETATYLKPIGDIFINLIKMLIVPLIFVSLVSGSMSMGNDIKRLGRIGLKTFSLYLVSTFLAIGIGLLIATIIGPGVGVNIAVSQMADVVKVKEAPGFMNTLVNLITKNPVGALADGNILQIIVFSVLFGLAISLSESEKVKPIVDFFDAAGTAVYKLVSMIMSLAPIGVFALIAWVIGKYGLEVIIPMLTVILCVYLGCIIHALVVIGGGIKVLTGLNPFVFFKGVLDPWAYAFATTSSSGTLPISMTAAQNNLGVSKRVSGFVLPLGATINMDGTALYQGVTVLFIAQAFNVDLTTMDYITVMLTTTLASIGTAGVPGAGLIMLSLVLTSVGLPLEGIAIIAGIDRILDMARTSINVVGDCAVSLVVGSSEKEVDKDIFYNKQQ